jgi:hypothetical protein
MRRTAVQRASLASIGRALLGGNVEHRIKRCWTSASSVEPRFCANDRIETADAMRGVVKRVLRKRRHKNPLLVSFDWTDLRGF